MLCVILISTELGWVQSFRVCSELMNVADDLSVFCLSLRCVTGTWRYQRKILIGASSVTLMLVNFAPPPLCRSPSVTLMLVNFAPPPLCRSPSVTLMLVNFATHLSLLFLCLSGSRQLLAWALRFPVRKTIQLRWLPLLSLCTLHLIIGTACFLTLQQKNL